MRGRIRTIKPELFTDEALWDLGQETGLPVLQGFTGLWCCADREGRFEWRPRALKTAILPYWSGDFAHVLDALEKGGFVLRYKVDEREYGLVRTFAKHQVINLREAKSTIPAPPVQTPDGSRAEQPRLTETHVHAHGEGNGNGNGKENPPNPPGGPDNPTSSSHIQEFREAFAGEAERLGWSPPPQVTANQLRSAAERARSLAKTQGAGYLAAARSLASAALTDARATNRPPGLCLLDAEPGRPRAGPGQSRMAPATTAVDFADAAPAEEQLAKIGRVR